jgi:hypothetical protein
VSARPCGEATRWRRVSRGLDDRMAQAVAQARPRKQCPHTFIGAVEAISQDAPDAVGRLLLECRALKHAIGLGQGRRTGVLGVAQMPDDAATDDRGEVHSVCETVTVLFIGQDIGGQGQTTSCQHCHHALGAERTDQPIEGHRGNMADDRAQFQTEPSMRR